MTTRELRDYVDWKALLASDVTKLPLANRILGKLHRHGDLYTVEQLLELSSVKGGFDFLDFDEDVAVRAVVHAVRTHPGSRVKRAGLRAKPA